MNEGIAIAESDVPDMLAKGLESYLTRPALARSTAAGWFIPCAPDVLTECLQHLAERRRAPSTINKHKAAIMAWHRCTDNRFPTACPR